jgi:tRNA-binding EMAP/Myf-like protein
MDDLTTTQGIAALAAGGVALLALIVATVLSFKLRRVRRAQSAVLGDYGSRDLVAHAERLEGAFTQLRDWVEESMQSIDSRMAHVEGRVDGCIAYHSLVRYDAYNELSGHQSTSMALLDSHRNGLVLSAIVHRDSARLYVKQVQDGESEVALSPEEQQAVETALASPLRAA